MTKSNIPQTGRDDCYFCHIEGPLRTHHPLPQAAPFNGPDEPWNRVELCGSCHDKVHGVYTDKIMKVIAPQLRRYGRRHGSDKPAECGRLDRYDQKVFDHFDTGGRASKKALVDLYIERAGVFDEAKIHRRINRLCSMGFLKKINGEYVVKPGE